MVFVSKLRAAPCNSVVKNLTPVRLLFGIGGFFGKRAGGVADERIGDFFAFTGAGSVFEQAGGAQILRDGETHRAENRAGGTA